VRREGDAMIVTADPLSGEAPADEGDVVTGEVIAPVSPLVVVGIAQNGPEHPSPVQAWLKSPRTVVAGGTSVTLRRDAGTAVAEGEICVVIGRATDGLTAARAHEYVLGLTAVNDLSSPDRTALDPRNFESKAGRGYTPLGPWIDTSADIDDVALEVDVDGRAVSRTSSTELPVPIRECLEYVSGWMPLEPGDIVMTGAPYSQAPVRPGQVVTVRVGRTELVTPLL
jgi:2-keto-4-pentenoate hydratase/2-oxohepta-3-ene-1,7-dioic acid hydratase in catechol pathway